MSTEYELVAWTMISVACSMARPLSQLPFLPQVHSPFCVLEFLPKPVLVANSGRKSFDIRTKFQAHWHQQWLPRHYIPILLPLEEVAVVGPSDKCRDE